MCSSMFEDNCTATKNSISNAAASELAQTSKAEGQLKVLIDCATEVDVFLKIKTSKEGLINSISLEAGDYLLVIEEVEGELYFDCWLVS